MPSGGARSRSGPAPDPNALRRDKPSDIAGWETLPSNGRPGAPPAWPLTFPDPDRADSYQLAIHSRELALWASFWAKPQAIIWERNKLVELVALFVRQFAEGEIPKSSAENRKTIRMLMADLYLTPDSLARARFKIADGAPETAAAPRFRKASVATHLTVVPSNDGA